MIVRLASQSDGSVSTRVIQDEGVTPAKLSNLAELRGEMGLGETLGVLQPGYGGTGVTTLDDLAELVASKVYSANTIVLEYEAKNGNIQSGTGNLKLTATESLETGVYLIRRFDLVASGLGPYSHLLTFSVTAGSDERRFQPFPSYPYCSTGAAAINATGYLYVKEDEITAENCAPATFNVKGGEDTEIAVVFSRANPMYVITYSSIKFTLYVSRL